MLNSRQIGEITELKCQMYCIEQGYTVSKRVIDNARYDLILDYNNKLYRIQIKTSRWTNEEHEALIFNCKSQHPTSEGNKILKYLPEEIDFFMTEFEGKFYLIPCEKAQSECKLRFKPTKNNQDNRCKFAKDYLFEEVLKKY